MKVKLCFATLVLNNSLKRRHENNQSDDQCLKNNKLKKYISQLN